MQQSRIKELDLDLVEKPRIYLPAILIISLVHIPTICAFNASIPLAF